MMHHQVKLVLSSLRKTNVPKLSISERQSQRPAGYSSSKFFPLKTDLNSLSKPALIHLRSLSPSILCPRRILKHDSHQIFLGPRYFTSPLSLSEARENVPSAHQRSSTPTFLLSYLSFTVHLRIVWHSNLPEIHSWRYVALFCVVMAEEEGTSGLIMNVRMDGEQLTNDFLGRDRRKP